MSEGEPSRSAHLEALATTTSDALITIDADSVVQFVNPAIEPILGYTPDELRGNSLTTIIPDGLAGQHLAAVDEYLADPTRHVDWEYVEFTGEHKDGHEVQLGVSISEFTVDGETHFAGVVRDITERKTLQAERSLLHATVREVAEADSFEAGLADALRLIGTRMNWVYGEAWVPAADPDGDAMEWQTTWTSADADLSSFRAASSSRTFEPGEGLVGRVWATAEDEWLSDVSAVEQDAFERTDEAAAHGLKAAFGVPILDGDSVVAVLVFLMPEARTVDDRMVEVTRTVAANLGQLMGRRRTEAALQAEQALKTKILETAPTGVLVVSPEGHVEYANEHAEDLFRLPGDGSEYPSYDELDVERFDEDGEPIPPEDRPLRHVLRTGDAYRRDVQHVHPDEDRRWVSIHAAPLRGDDGEITAAVFAAEDVTARKRRERQLTRLSEVSRALIRAETREDVCARTVEAARTVLDLPITAISLYDDPSGQLQPAAETDAVSDLRSETRMFAPDQDLVWEVFLDREPRVIDDLETEAGLDPAASPLSSVIVLPVGEYGVLVSGDTASNAFTESEVTLAEILASITETALDRVAREGTLREKNAELERRNAELERVHRINRVIRDITKALTHAKSREDVYQAVCDQLAAAEPYRFAWFGSQDPGTDEIVPLASAGEERGYLDSVTVTADDEETGQGPAGRAFRTGEPQVQNNLASDPPFEPWREEALRRNHRASISIPVTFRDSVYGVVNLYASEAGIFSETETTVLGELGETIGYALSALERKEALVAGRSIELEFEIYDESDPLFQFLAETGAGFVLENVVANTLATLSVFCTFEGVSYAEIESFAGGDSSDTDVTLIRETDTECVVEFTVPGDSIISALIDRGAMPKTARASGEAATLTLQVAPTGSVREYVDMLTQRYAAVELTARRERDEPIQTREEFRAEYTNHLTEREREVIQTAYYAGFFEWPRENSTQDVAEMLDVSQPTVSRYLRAGERKLFSLLYEGTPPAD